MQLLAEGDLLLANRGFDIHHLAPPGVTIITPSFMEGRPQLPLEEERESGPPMRVSHSSRVTLSFVCAWHSQLACIPGFVAFLSMYFHMHSFVVYNMRYFADLHRPHTATYTTEHVICGSCTIMTVQIHTPTNSKWRCHLLVTNNVCFFLRPSRCPFQLKEVNIITFVVGVFGLEYYLNVASSRW